MLPRVRELERAFPDEVVAVGVEAGKFPAERVTANIRQAVLRLEVDHPVVNDRHFRIWRSYAVNAWPTLILVDPEGNVRDVHAGEIDLGTYEPNVARLVHEGDARGVLDRRPVDFIRPERLSEPERPLAFPGRVLATGDGRLFIADSNHNRILIVGLDPDGETGQVRDVVGSGAAGLDDGDFASARFHRPQGLGLGPRPITTPTRKKARLAPPEAERTEETLYVADSANHAIRAIDLRSRRVTTVAGTGHQGRGTGAMRPGTSMALSSPWDVAEFDGGLYVAMAGTHQIYRFDVATGEMGLYAGSGLEDIVDGLRFSSALAQPMGLVAVGQHLFVACAESSAVRRVDLPPGDRVETIVGIGLFDYGDRDGVGDDARLQHDQDVAWADNRLYLADTYNNKIKLVDPATRRVVTLHGSDSPGDRDGDAPLFDEPSGVSVANGKLYIADTNNHLIQVADLTTRRVVTLVIRF